MGSTRCSFPCHISASASERAKVVYRVVSTYQQHLRQKKGITKKLILTLRAVMISQEDDLVAGDFNGLHGGIAAKTTSVLLTKHLWTVSCLRHRAPHHCGDQDPFRTIGPTSVDFSNRLALSDPGK